MDEEELEELGFHCLGFAVVCDTCDTKVQLPAAETLEQALADAQRKGFTVQGCRHYCSRCGPPSFTPPERK